MRKNCWTSKRILAYWLPLVFLVGCSPEPLVTGQVVDEFGKPVVGATVQVQGTTFRGSTDSGGKYSVPYVPGNFTVDIQKQGFTSAEFSLNIASPMRYPAASVTLIPIPPIPGFYLFGRSDYQSVYYGSYIAARVVDNVQRIGVLDFAFKDQEFSLSTGGKSVPAFSSGHLKFLDSVSPTTDFKLVRVGENGRILYRKHFMDGTVKDSISIIPEQIKIVDQVLIRETDLGPGHYAYVAFVPQKINWAQTLPTPLELGYEFWVK